MLVLRKCSLRIPRWSYFIMNTLWKWKLFLTLRLWYFLSLLLLRTILNSILFHSLHLPFLSVRKFWLITLLRLGFDCLELFHAPTLLSLFHIQWSFLTYNRFSCRYDILWWGNCRSARLDRIHIDHGSTSLLLFNGCLLSVSRLRSFGICGFASILIITFSASVTCRS